MYRYYWGSEIKGDEMGRICSTHGGDRKWIKNFSQKVKRQTQV
jgi:hypothetical protein